MGGLLVLSYVWHAQRGPQISEGLQFPQDWGLQNTFEKSPQPKFGACTGWEADLFIWYRKWLAAEVEPGTSNTLFILLLYILANTKATWPQSRVQKRCASTPETFKPPGRERNRKGSSVLFANMSLWSPWHATP